MLSWSFEDFKIAAIDTTDGREEKTRPESVNIENSQRLFICFDLLQGEINCFSLASGFFVKNDNIVALNAQCFGTFGYKARGVEYVSHNEDEMLVAEVFFETQHRVFEKRSSMSF